MAVAWEDPFWFCTFWFWALSCHIGSLPSFGGSNQAGLEVPGTQGAYWFRVLAYSCVQEWDRLNREWTSIIPVKQEFHPKQLLSRSWNWEQFLRGFLLPLLLSLCKLTIQRWCQPQCRCTLSAVFPTLSVCQVHNYPVLSQDQTVRAFSLCIITKLFT